MDRHRLSLQEGSIDVYQWKGHLTRYVISLICCIEIGGGVFSLKALYVIVITGKELVVGQ